MTTTDKLAPTGMLRFGKEEHIRTLVNDGLLYFNTIEYFKKNHDSKNHHPRFDKYEGVDVVVQPRDIARYEVAGRQIDVFKEGPPVAMTLSDRLHFTHICCFSIIYNKSIVVDGVERIFDPAMFSLDESFALITKPRQFVEHVIKVLRNVSEVRRFQGAQVEYKDLSKYSGEMGPFRKPDEFAYQEEFRIALEIESDSPFRLKVGSLGEYAFGPILKKDCKNIVVKGKGIFS